MEMTQLEIHRAANEPALDLVLFRSLTDMLSQSNPHLTSFSVAGMNLLESEHTKDAFNTLASCMERNHSLLTLNLSGAHILVAWWLLLVYGQK
jgi:hypothetical protein